MFSQPVYWRINNLITTLTKKNNKTHTAELSELTKMYEMNSKVFLIASMLNEIDFRDQRTTGHRDTQKVPLTLTHPTPFFNDCEITFNPTPGILLRSPS